MAPTFRFFWPPADFAKELLPVIRSIIKGELCYWKIKTFTNILPAWFLNMSCMSCACESAFDKINTQCYKCSLWMTLSHTVHWNRLFLHVHPDCPLYASPSICQPSLIPVSLFAFLQCSFSFSQRPSFPCTNNCVCPYTVCTRTSSACVSHYCAGRRG